MPSISVIVCTYNRAQLVPRAIRSVLAQQYRDFEIVVVDDGSTDDTEAVVRELGDERVRYVSQSNAGLSAARNTGVANAAGAIVTFLDDDDEVLPEWLGAFARTLDGHDVGTACLGAIAVDERGTEVNRVLPHPLGPAFEDYTGLFRAGTFALHRRAYDAAGGFAAELRSNHQTEFSLRLLPLSRERGWPVLTIDEALVRHTARPASVRTRTARNLVDGVAYIVGHHETQLARSPETLANYCAVAGVAAARLGEYADARQWLRRAAHADPRNWRHRARLVLTYVPGARNLVWKTGDFRT